MVGLRKQRWITLGGDRGRHEQVRLEVKTIFLPYVMARAGEPRTGDRLTGGPVFPSWAVGLWR